MPKPMPKGLRPLIAFGHFALGALPVRTASNLMAYALGRKGGSVLNMATMKANLHDAFPHLDGGAVDALSTKIAENFGRLTAEIVHIGTFKKGRQGTCIDISAPDGMVVDGRGPVIFVGAHVGCWELLPLAFGSNAKNVTIIYSRNKSPVVDKVLHMLRPKTGASYVEKSKGLRPCVEALDKGGALALLVDQRVDSGLEVDFFGRPTVVTRLPARLAMRFGCPIIPFEITRPAAGQLRMTFQDAIMPDAFEGPDPEAAITQRVAHVVQDSITRNADSWFCNKRRWKAKTKKPKAAPNHPAAG